MTRAAFGDVFNPAHIVDCNDGRNNQAFYDSFPLRLEREALPPPARLETSFGGGVTDRHCRRRHSKVYRKRPLSQRMNRKAALSRDNHEDFTSPYAN
jgi:hypothetical protein